MAKIEIRPQPGPQEQLLSTLADIAIFGGAAGSGKTYSLLLDPLRHYNNPHFGAVIFRRTSVQVRNEGALWDESMKLYPLFGAVPREVTLEWRFPKGMNISFSHLEYDKDIFSWQGAQLAFIGFDELTHFTETQFFYLMSRLRSTSGAKPRIRATCNPDPDSFVRRFIDWWIGDDGFPIKDRSGKLRWFIRRNDEFLWADSAEELCQLHGADSQPKSVTFIGAKLQDNKILMEKDPAYLGNLLALNRVDRMRLLDGNWNVRESSGMLFKREWFQVIDTVPGGWIQAIRFWDRACLVADTKVITNQGEKEIQNIKVGDLVLTRKGFKKVTWSGISKRTNEIISVVFSNGSVISGTSCHPTYTTNRGWVKLAELKGTDKVLWKKSSSTEKDISFSTEENITSTVKGTSTIMSGMASDASISLGCSIETSGNSTMGPSPMVILSTIKTGIELTTTLKTLNVSQENPTDKHIKVISLSQLILKIQNITKKHTLLFQEEFRNSKNINVKHAENCSKLEASKQSIVLCNALNHISIIAKIVDQFLKREGSTLNIAISHALTVDVPVYDLTVDDAHEFFADGILVHNSTKPNESNKDPDWTRGLKLYKYPNGIFIVVDLKSARDTPGQIERLVVNVAAHDGYSVTIMSQQDPGSAGVAEAEHFIRMLVGYDVRVETMAKDKVTRAKPVSAQCEAGNIKVLRGSWNDEFFNELENFPEGNHDDCVDVLSGAFNAMSHGLSIADALWGR